MKITTLMENTASAECYTAEHGLSIYIETKNHVILFDSGASGAFADNAEKLGVDLGKVEMAVLSHGHYDHGGGLPRFMEKNKTAPIYMSACAFEPHLKNGGFKKRRGGRYRTEPGDCVRETDSSYQRGNPTGGRHHPVQLQRQGTDPSPRHQRHAGETQRRAVPGRFPA